MVEEIIVTIFLGIGTIIDIRKKSVSKNYLIWGGFLVFLYFAMIMISDNPGKSLSNAILGVIPGIISLFFSFISREQIGFGDGWVIALIGLIMGLNNILIILFVALLALTIVAILMLVIGKVKGKTTIPFIPFIFLGHIVVFIFGSIL